MVKKIIVESIKVKTLVRKRSPGLAQISLNPYQGCEHDCKYCDGKAENYYMHEDFATRIKYKENATELLEQFFRKEGYKKEGEKEKEVTLDRFIKNNEKETKGKKEEKKTDFVVFIGGGVCDVYQPIEEKVKITRKLLEKTLEYSLPVEILTKNKLVTRDIDLLKKINEKNYACVGMTITLTDQKEQERFEPKASTTEERFETIKKLRSEGIHAGIYFAPVIPFIGDKEENIKKMYEKAKEAKAEFMIMWGLTLKEGRNKKEFMEVIKKDYPELEEKYKELFGNKDKYGTMDKKKCKEMNLVDIRRKSEVYSKKYDIPNYIPPIC